jgi:hypothetical protein
LVDGKPPEEPACELIEIGKGLGIRPVEDEDDLNRPPACDDLTAGLGEVAKGGVDQAPLAVDVDNQGEVDARACTRITHVCPASWTGQGGTGERFVP